MKFTSRKQNYAHNYPSSPSFFRFFLFPLQLIRLVGRNNPKASSRSKNPIQSFDYFSPWPSSFCGKVPPKMFPLNQIEWKNLHRKIGWKKEEEMTEEQLDCLSLRGWKVGEIFPRNLTLLPIELTFSNRVQSWTVVKFESSVPHNFLIRGTFPFNGSDSIEFLGTSENEHWFNSFKFIFQLVAALPVKRF